MGLLVASNFSLKQDEDLNCVGPWYVEESYFSDYDSRALMEAEVIILIFMRAMLRGFSIINHQPSSWLGLQNSW